MPGPFILAVEWSEENYCFLYFMAPVRCMAPGCAAEKSMPDGSVGDRSNGSMLFSISPRGELCRGGYSGLSQPVINISTGECSECAEACFMCIVS